MNIVYIADDSYIPLMCVSLTSLLLHEKEKHISVSVLSVFISEEKKTMVYEKVQKFPNVRVTFLSVGSVISFCQKNHLPDWRGSYTMYSRLFISDYLPGETRALIIDVDTLIRHSLDELWSWDLQGKALGGAIEPFRYDYIAIRNAGMDLFDGIYINTGILLMDLARMRQLDYKQRIIDAVSHHQIFVVDQDIFNFGFQDEISVFPPKFDFTSATFYLSYWEYKKCYYQSWRITKGDYVEAKKDPTIVHFDTSWDYHPWVKHSGVLFGREWLKVYRMVFGNEEKYFEKPKKTHFLRKFAYLCLPGFAKRSLKRFNCFIRLVGYRFKNHQGESAR